MDKYRFLVHGSLLAITPNASDHLRKFERAGGHIEMWHREHEAILSYEDHCTQITAESLIHILEQLGTHADGTHGVLAFGREHHEPSILHIGQVSGIGLLTEAIASIHIRGWLLKKGV